MKHAIIFTPLFVFLLAACKDQKDIPYNTQSKDTIVHGYNELANPDGRTALSISDYNTDNSDIDNIKRPSGSVIQTTLDTTLLFAVWVKDPDGPHADFEISAESFLIADYDGDGDMPYELVGDKLKIYYNDFIQEGQIISVTKDSLKIRWEYNEGITSFVRW